MALGCSLCRAERLKAGWNFFIYFVLVVYKDQSGGYLYYYSGSST